MVVAARIPCSEFAVAAECRRLSLRTSKVAYAGGEWERAGVRKCSTLKQILRAKRIDDKAKAP